MTSSDSTQWEKRLEIPGRVSFLEGVGDLPMIKVRTEWSTAEIYLQGAQVTRFQKKSEPPILFLSQVSRFETRHPIRGGIPIVLPWFGAREGGPTHGFARINSWDLKEIITSANGSISLRFRLPDCAEAAVMPSFTAEYTVTVSDALDLQLVVTNTSTGQELAFEECLHSYFLVEDIGAASVLGLKGVKYEDKTDHFATKMETEDALRVSAEVDRVYQDTSGPLEIHDSRLRRKILISKEGSASSVVWNPWVAKAQQMPDFGNEEYLKMICVEPGNVGANKLTLAPGQSSRMTVRISSAAL